MSIDQAAVAKLAERTHREVDDGLLPSCQWALAYEGEIVASETYGDATPDTRYSMFSSIKPFVASLIWQLMAEGLVDPAERVVTYFPEFGANGKDVITVEQVMLHTSGFPRVPLGPPRWADREDPPGGHGELEAQLAARQVLRVPPDLGALGARRDRRTGSPAVTTATSSSAASPARSASAGSWAWPATSRRASPSWSRWVRRRHPTSCRPPSACPSCPGSEVTLDAMMAFNDPANREVGVPGGGGVIGANNLALFYQELLHNKAGLWPADLLADVTGNVRNSKPDPLTKTPANRSLGLILAGDDGRSHFRGMGRTLSAKAFGHNGAGGQLAWADPATGLSFAYMTNGLDQHAVREPKRGTAIDSLAGLCATS